MPEHNDRLQDDDHAEERLGESHVVVHAAELGEHKPQDLYAGEDQQYADDKPDENACHESCPKVWCVISFDLCRVGTTCPGNRAPIAKPWYSNGPSENSLDNRESNTC